MLLWDGPADRPILRYDAWYCKVSRLRFDGRKKANGGLVRAGGFSTYCELSDLVFQDIKGIAVNLGNAEAYGAAEHAILRCKFLRCGEGISTINWNTLDINAGGAGGADGLLVDDADQAGGRVYGDQLNTSGAGGNHRCAAAIHVDGLQRANVTITSGGFGSCLSGIKVRGGAGRDARKASNQVAFLTGGTSDGCRLLDVVEGGSVVGEAFWYEGDWDYAAALLDLPEGSSGSISLAAAWWHMDSPKHRWFRSTASRASAPSWAVRWTIATARSYSSEATAATPRYCWRAAIASAAASPRSCKRHGATRPRRQPGLLCSPATGPSSPIRWRTPCRTLSSYLTASHNCVRSGSSLRWTARRELPT